MTAENLAHQFLNALSLNDPTQLEAVLSEDVTLRLHRWDGFEARRKRTLVIQYFSAEWERWPDPSLLSLNVLNQGNRAAVEFRIQATENKHYVEHNRSAFLTIKEDKIIEIDLYCAEPVPSARRGGWIAPATLSDEDLNRLLDTNQYMFDPRDGIFMNTNASLSLRHFRRQFGGTHPGENWVGNTRWSAEETDAKIKGFIAHFKERKAGFCWHIGPFDTPTDLAQRLIVHGFVLAGESAVMARRGLNDLSDIPHNPALKITVLKGTKPEENEAALHIMAVSFQWTEEQINQRRDFLFEKTYERMKRNEEITYLAWLNDAPVAMGRIKLHGSTAYLGGAATLPGYRGQKVYSSLLKYRLKVARNYGHHFATIDALPMSRPIVARYGFKAYNKAYIYAWMPVIDMEVIRSLMPA